jgi:PncC family amidohydrolase
MGATELAAHCLGMMRVRGESLAAAESLTAGLITSTFASVPGASDVLLGGIASYATEVKVSVLGVPREVIDEHGVISAECAAEMAGRARVLFGADWAVAATGVAGPDEQDGHPVGEVYVAVASREGATVESLDLDGDRDEIRASATEQAMALLERRLTAASTGSRAG